MSHGDKNSAKEPIRELDVQMRKTSLKIRHCGWEGTSGPPESPKQASSPAVAGFDPAQTLVAGRQLLQPKLVFHTWAHLLWLIV